MSPSTGASPVEGNRRVGRRRRSAAGLLLGCVAGALAALAAPAAPASAHAALLTTSPAARSVLASPPVEIVMTFSEPVRPVSGTVRVLAPDGSRIDTGKPTVAGAVLRVQVRRADRPLGTYVTSYRVISADNHPVAGAFTFSAGAPSAAPAVPPVGGGGDRVTGVAVVIVKYLGYLGLVLAIGPALVLSRLWPSGLPRRGPARLVHTGLALLGAGTLAGLWLQAPYTAGTPPLDTTLGAVASAARSGFGVAMAVRAVAVLASALLLRPVLDGRAGRTRGVVVTAVALLGLASWPLSGHAMASPLPVVTVAADMVHLAAAAVWLGGLLTVVAFLLRRVAEADLTAALGAWSRWAALAVCWLVAGGAVQALIEVGGPQTLLRTGYGRLMLGKFALLAVVLAVAAYCHRLVRRRAGGVPRVRLRRAVWAEAGLIAVVLALSAALVQANPGAERAAAASGPAGTGPGSTQSLDCALYTLQFEVYPAHVGDNTLHLYAYAPDGRPLAVAGWRVVAALPRGSIEAIEAPVLPIGDNHAVGELTLPATGRWQLRFTLRVSEFDQATVTATVAVG
jgi:copper transport protein